MAFFSKRLYFRLQRCGADSQIIILPGGIDVCQDHAVRQGQSLCELLQKCLCPGVSVGLEDAPELFVRKVPGGFQGGGDFFGMVGVVVNYGDTAYGSLILEPAVRPLVGFQCFYYNIVVNGKPVGQRDGSHGVVYVMLAGDLQGETALTAVGTVQEELGPAQSVIADIGRMVIRGSSPAEGDNGAAQAFCNLGQVFDLTVDDKAAVFRQQQGVFAERMPDVCQVLEKIQMVCTDVQDDADFGGKVQEAVGVLASSRIFRCACCRRYL